MTKRTSVPSEQTEAPPTKLGEVLREFRWLFRLNQIEAARVLGVGISTLQNYEIGHDKLKRPVNPRENTLELIANRMHEHAAEHDRPYLESPRELYKRLLVAAGKISQAELDFQAGRDEEPTDEQLAEGEMNIPGLSDIAADSLSGWSQLSDEDRRLIRETVAATARVMIEQRLAGLKQRKLR